MKGASYLILAGVFVLGSVAGAGATYGWVQSDHAAAVRSGKAHNKHKLKALSRRLDLDADQRARLRAILDEDDTESAVISHDVLQRCGQPLRAHERHVNDEIRGVLRPDQKRRFERIVQHDP